MEKAEMAAEALSLSLSHSEAYANCMGRRLTAPLTRANVKRCRKKFAKMELHDEQNSLASLLGSTSTIELHSSSDGASLQSSNEQRQLISSKKQQKRARTKMQSPPKVYAADSGQQQLQTAVPEVLLDKVKIAENAGRTRRTRKRMNFLRRSTSRFSSKSAPG